MPSSESPHWTWWSRNVNGRSFAIVVSHSDSLAISSGHRVAVDAVQAVVGRQRAARRASIRSRGRLRESPAAEPAVGLGLPRLDEAVGEVAAGRDEDGAGADGRVADLQVEQLGRRLQLPLGRVGALGGPGE